MHNLPILNTLFHGHASQGGAAFPAHKKHSMPDMQCWSSTRARLCCSDILGTAAERKAAHKHSHLLRDPQEGQGHWQSPGSPCRAGMGGKAAEAAHVPRARAPPLL